VPPVELLIVFVNDPGLDTAVYFVIVAPPLLDGALNVTFIALELDHITPVIVGAPGTVIEGPTAAPMTPAKNPLIMLAPHH
jgi:hypothetical protein